MDSSGFILILINLQSLYKKAIEFLFQILTEIDSIAFLF